MESLASTLLALLALALLLAYVHGGWQGIGRWLHAHYIGQG